MKNHDEIIKNLFKRIEELEYRHKKEIQILKNEINDLKSIDGDSVTLDNSIRKEQAIIPDVKPKEVKKPSHITENTIKATYSVIKKEELKTVAAKKPSFLSLKVKEFLAPLNEGLELFLDAYSKYKKEGKLPIFLMTIAGIIAILFGFGYLMQLTFNNLGIYQTIAKIGIGFISSIILATIGIRISAKDKALNEYGSSLISLSIIINYLMIYFMSDLGNFPVLSSGIIGFVLICLNTLISIYLSIRYNSKVISVISLIGGAFAPMYLNAMGDGDLYYLYLWLLGLGSFYTSTKQQWKELNYITYVIIIGCLEFMVFKHSTNSIIYAVYYHLFSYLFFYIALFDNFKLKNNLEKSDLIILASSLSIFLYNLYTAFENNLPTLGIIYTSNAILFSGFTIVKWKKLNSDNKLTLFIVIGALIGLAIPSIFGQKLMGLFWSIEALTLVIFGFRFSLSTIRKEGYILLCIAFFKLIYSSLEIVNNWNNTLWHAGFLNYIILGAVLTSMWFLGKKHFSTLLSFERKLYQYTQEIVPLWIGSVYYIVGYHVMNDWIFTLAFIPLFGFILWKKHFNTKATDIFGLFNLLIYIGFFSLSMLNAYSYHFSDQDLPTQIAIVQFLGILWLLKSFYKKFKINHTKTFNLTKGFRIIFFCILPLIIISTVKRNAFDFIELGFWASSLVTYVLFKKLKYHALKIEFYLLSSLSLAFCFLENDPTGFIGGIFFISCIIFSEKAINYTKLSESQFKNYINILPFTSVLLIGYLIFSLKKEYLALSFSIPSLSLILMAFFYNQLGFIKENYKIAISLSLISNLFGLFCLLIYDSSISLIISIINISLCAIILNNRRKWFSKLYGRKWNQIMVFHQGQCIIITSLILVFFNIDLDGPITSILLATHAVIILFVAMKNQIKILNKISLVLFASTLLKIIFNDISDFKTFEKIIVLIIIGIILLSASYGYVKLSKYFQNTLKEPELNNSSKDLLTNQELK
ncbi:DUF2339 domain-containing protein [Wenyingzhuangia sp. IMCC45574]